MTEKEVFDWLTQVEHPGRDDKDIVSLGMVEEVVVEDGKVSVTLAFGKRPSMRPKTALTVSAAR